MSPKVNLIAILSYGRSGTGLVSSLFDGHKDVSIFPDHLLQNFYKFWNFYQLENKELIIKKFIQVYEIFFTPKNKKFYSHKSVGLIGSVYLCGFTQLGEKKNSTIYVDKKKFLKYLNKFFTKNTFNRRNFFIGIHFAYNYCIYKKEKTKNIVFNFHVPSKENFKELLVDFPDTKFIQTIREPLNSMYSLFRAYNTQNYFNGAYIHFIFNMIKSRGEYNFINNKNLFYLKLEDLHNNPKKTLKSICKKIPIRFNKILLKSSINNLKWYNEIGSIRVSGFNNQIVKQNYTNFFWCKDNIIFYHFLHDKYETFKYKKSKKFNRIIIKLIIYPLILLPFKIEYLQVKKKLTIYKIKMLLKGYIQSRILIFNFLNKKKIFRIN